MTVIGAYVTNVNIFDINVMFIFGFLGLSCVNWISQWLTGTWFDFGVKWLIKDSVTLMQGQGSIMPLLGRPIGLILIGVIILSIISGMRKYAKDKAVHQETSTDQRDLLMINNKG